VGSTVVFGQTSALPPPPISYRVLQQLGSIPQLWRAPAAVAPEAKNQPAPVTTLGSWQAVTTDARVDGLSNPLLMTDGTVIAHNPNAGDWWQLTPDGFGNYATGTWSKFATLPVVGGIPYTPLYFASEVLPDGRVIINGGEYNGSGLPVLSTRGAIYYPSFGAWINVPPPAGWFNIGDAQSVVLNDGTYMLANCCDLIAGALAAALFDATPPFTSLNWTRTGTGKRSSYDEEGWTVLPDGDVLTVDIETCDMNSEIYSAGAGTWSSASSTIVELSTCSGPVAAIEIGPQVLRPDGTLVAFGGVNEGTDPTAIFDPTAGTWSVGPTIPSVAGVPYTLADAPAATLPSGNVLFAASPSNWVTITSYPSPTHFFELSTTNTITPTADTPNAPSEPSFIVNFLVLPTGQVLATDFSSTAQIYTESGTSPDPAWAPVINTSPTDVTRAHTDQLTGAQFNGLSHGAAFGDDVQANTNYPIVAIVNNSTGHVFYERSFGFNTMSVAPNTASSTNFTVSGVTETGPSTLYVIANGISSTGVPLTVH
jgi:hypothetical protein